MYKFYLYFLDLSVIVFSSKDANLNVMPELELFIRTSFVFCAIGPIR